MQAVEARVLVSILEHHETVGSGCRHNQVVQLEKHATVFIDGRPPPQHFPEGLVLHGEIGVLLSMHQNPLIHVPQCLQDSTGQKSVL
jgi:hypothetical protein